MAKTEFGQELSSQAANDVYLLKTEDDTIIGVLSLEEGVDVNKYVSDLQEYLYELADTSGVVGQTDPNRKVYSSTNYIANGDSRKAAIEKLDTQVKANADIIALNTIAIADRLTRGANDFSTFTEKVTPVDDDIVIIEDSEDSGNKKYLRLENMIGGGGGIGFQEVPTGVVNGINTDFDITLTPSTEDSLLVIVNGIILERSEWSLSYPTITLNNAPAPGQSVYVFYLTDGSSTPPVTSPGAENVEYIDITALMITNKELTLSNTPAITTNTVVDVIGGTSQRYGADFTVSSNVLSWNLLGLESELTSGDVLRIQYLS